MIRVALIVGIGIFNQLGVFPRSCGLFGYVCELELMRLFSIEMLGKKDCVSVYPSIPIPTILTPILFPT